MLLWRVLMCWTMMMLLLCPVHLVVCLTRAAVCSIRRAAYCCLVMLCCELQSKVQLALRRLLALSPSLKHLSHAVPPATLQWLVLCKQLPHCPKAHLPHEVVSPTILVPHLEHHSLVHRLHDEREALVPHRVQRLLLYRCASRALHRLCAHLHLDKRVALSTDVHCCKSHRSPNRD